MSLQFIFNLFISSVEPRQPEEPIRDFLLRVAQHGLTDRDVDRYYKERESALEGGVLYSYPHAIQIDRDCHV
jgi:hypothetical protein